MSAAPIMAEQIRAIHAIKTRVRLDEASYRAMLQGYGVASSKDMSRADADRLLARLRDIPGASSPVQRAKATGRFAPKLQAMWLALYNLGAVKDRRDAAMHAFVKRQCRIEHTRFLNDPHDAAAAIEALKDWLIRMGVAWPAVKLGCDADVVRMKLAILRAQWLRLVALGAVQPFGPAEQCDGLVEYASKILRGAPRRLGSLDDPSLTKADLDAVSARLGSWIRFVQAKAEMRDAG